jgi:hypothetical protein
MNSEKYDLFKKRPIIQLHNNIYKASFSITKKYIYHYTISTHIYDNKVYWFMYVYIVSPDKHHCVEFSHQYIYDQNIKKSLLPIH